MADNPVTLHVVEPVIEPKREYFVTVRDGKRTGFLLGPYATHAAALAEVDRGRALANGATPWAAFYAFGTSSAPAGAVKKTVFGK